MGLFRRRPRGRHAPGAPAVHAAPLVPPAPAPLPAVRAPEAAPHAVPVVAPADVHEQPGPRVSLGFRDGSTAALDPESEQALALAELSQLLARRD